MTVAVTVSPFAQELLDGPQVAGMSLGHGHLLFGNRVLSLTAPGQLRMPNGIECELPVLESGVPVRAGNGRLECGFVVVHGGSVWDPIPQLRFAVQTVPRLERGQILSMCGRGPGLTPLGDDVLIGYLAARALLSEPSPDLAGLASTLGSQTTSLSATLLALAAQGRLPEAAHRLLAEGDPKPLLNWGATSGSGLLAGLGLFGVDARNPVTLSLEVDLSVDQARHFSVEVRTQ